MSTCAYCGKALGKIACKGKGGQLYCSALCSEAGDAFAPFGHAYFSDQEVRIKETAFGDSDDFGDLLARGSVGVLVWVLEADPLDTLWEWRSVEFPWLTAAVCESEIEPVNHG